jgi:hypothetical protein
MALYSLVNSKMEWQVVKGCSFCPMAPTMKDNFKTILQSQPRDISRAHKFSIKAALKRTYFMDRALRKEIILSLLESM